MAYNWAQLAFVEKWRLNGAVRGQIVGMYRPADRTFFDLRLRPGEGGVGQLSSTLDLRLVDAGDIIREKRIGLLARAAVVVRVAATPTVPVSGSPSMSSPASVGRSARWLETGSAVSGKVLQADGDVLLVDVGLPIVVQLPEGEDFAAPSPGQVVDLRISETPKGFIVV